MHLRVWLLLLATSCVASSGYLRDREIDWALDVLLGSEDGDERNGVVRWRQPVRYLVVGGSVYHRECVERAWQQLRAALAGTHELKLAFVAPDDRRIGRRGFATIFFTAPNAAGELVRKHRTRPAHAGVDGWFTINWSGRLEIVRAVVFIDPELSPRWLRHTVLEEMLQVLGPANDSPSLPESVVYEGGGTSGSSGELADVDRQLLGLLYGRLQPGDGEREVRAAMRGHWQFDR